MLRCSSPVLNKSLTLQQSGLFLCASPPESLLQSGSRAWSSGQHVAPALLRPPGAEPDFFRLAAQMDEQAGLQPSRGGTPGSDPPAGFGLKTCFQKF